MRATNMGMAVSIGLTLAGGATAQDAAHPLLILEQHRASIVQRIANEWAAELESLPGERRMSREQFAEALWMLRSDRLLAASLAGSVSTIGTLLADGRAERDASTRRAAAKSLGDVTASLVYTPINPCRIVDTRAAGGPLAANVARVFAGYAASFSSQGGGATDCGMPNGVAAIAMNVYAVNPSNLGFIKVWAANAPEPAVSTVNYQPGITAIATGAIVPVDGAVNNQFAAKSPAQVDFIADVVGYFRTARNADGSLELSVSTGRALRLEPYAVGPNLIAGSAANFAVAGAYSSTIGGGGAFGSGYPQGGGQLTCSNGVAGAEPCANVVTDHGGTIGGGASNRVGDTTGVVDVAALATVGGGFGNIAGKKFATVGGGLVNRADGLYATVGGGWFNVGSDFWATVGGGFGNQASASSSTVGGGTDNVASGLLSSVGGGQNNVASGTRAAIGGGLGNSASGTLSTVPGGYNNLAVGNNSFVAGTYGEAQKNGCFVFADGSTSNRAGCIGADNEVVMRGIGGFYFLSGGDSYATYTGVTLPPGANAWTTFSDASGKENLQPVEGREILRRLAQVPIGTWNWKSQGPEVRHIGPMAGDFWRAFRLGEDRTRISTVDIDGVALAAIQGLHDIVRKKEAVIARQAAELRRALRRIDAIEQKLAAR